MTNSTDELLEAAKVSTDPTVRQALNKLLFVTSIAHDQEYVERANLYYFHSGCTVTIPYAENLTMNLVWNDEDIAVHTTEYQYATFKYGQMLYEHAPLPGIILIEDRNYKT